MFRYLYNAYKHVSNYWFPTQQEQEFPMTMKILHVDDPSSTPTPIKHWKARNKIDLDSEQTLA